MLKAFLLGLLASAFFALTFILNREIAVGGGHWLWSAALRFFWMLPMLLVLVMHKRRLGVVLAHIRTRPLAWFGWSTVGFGIFYLFICLASTSSPGWLVAATWQVTILAGPALSPIFRPRKTGTPAGGTEGIRDQPAAALASAKAGPASVIAAPASHRFPLGQLLIAAIILGGIILVQAGQGIAIVEGEVPSELASSANPEDPDRPVALPVVPASWAGALFVLVAAFAYPLGNRKMMQVASNELGTLERVFGMTLCSLPFWLVVAGLGLGLRITPTSAQVVQTFLVALFSGVIATLLFFRATEMVKDHPGQLAAVESTQAGEVAFSLLGGVLVFGDQTPGLFGALGLALVVAGLLLNPLISSLSGFGKPRG